MSKEFKIIKNFKLPNITEVSKLIFEIKCT